MAYLWLTDDRIQGFLDTESNIIIADNYTSAEAQKWENLVVRMIVDFLSSVYNISVGHDNDEYLKDLAAQYTAACIGAGRMGASMGMGVAEWTDRYKNEVTSALARKIIQQSTISGVVTKTVSLHERLIYAKFREQGVVPNE